MGHLMFKLILLFRYWFFLGVFQSGLFKYKHYTINAVINTLWLKQ